MPSLGLVKKSARWVPKLLSQEQKLERVHTLTFFMELIQDKGASVLDRVITRDELLCLCTLPPWSSSPNSGWKREFLALWRREFTTQGRRRWFSPSSIPREWSTTTMSPKTRLSIRNASSKPCRSFWESWGRRGLSFSVPLSHVICGLVIEK